MENNHKAEDTQKRELRVQEAWRSSPKLKSSGGKKKRTSWISVISGWLAALGATLVLGSVFAGTLVTGDSEPQSQTVRLLVTLTVSFLVGGYVSGRMAGFYGLKHGLLVAFFSLILSVVLGLTGLAMGVSLPDNVNGATLPKLSDTRKVLELASSPSVILATILSFAGGAIGGALGSKAFYKEK